MKRNRKQRHVSYFLDAYALLQVRQSPLEDSLLNNRKKQKAWTTGFQDPCSWWLFNEIRMEGPLHHADSPAGTSLTTITLVE